MEHYDKLLCLYINAKVTPMYIKYICVRWLVCTNRLVNSPFSSCATLVGITASLMSDGVYRASQDAATKCYLREVEEKRRSFSTSDGALTTAL